MGAEATEEVQLETVPANSKIKVNSNVTPHRARKQNGVALIIKKPGKAESLELIQNTITFISEPLALFLSFYTTTFLPVTQAQKLQVLLDCSPLSFVSQSIIILIT